MSSANDAAELLNEELKKFGSSELKYASSLFSGKRSAKPDLHASIKNKQFRVIMFEGSEGDGMPSASAHFTMNINSEGVTGAQMAYWNADNRFTKMYQQDEDAVLVMDQFLSSTDPEAARSAAAIWASAVDELSRFKFVFDRMRNLR